MPRIIWRNYHICQQLPGIGVARESSPTRDSDVVALKFLLKFPERHPLGIVASPAQVFLDGIEDGNPSRLGRRIRNYGSPFPFIYFVGQPNQMIMGMIAVSDSGTPFTFSSIDLYSSVTTIPYTFTGCLANNQVFTVSGTVPNTYGNFATVLNPYP